MEMNKHLQSLPDIKGIIQIGSNSGQETGIFKQFTNNIILCEPVPNLSTQLKNNFPNCLVIPYALGSSDMEDMDFYISSNRWESSSLLKPLNHLKFYPHILFEKKHQIKVPVRKFKSIIEEFNIDINNYNVLVSDTQGYDLQAIKGFEELILNIDMIISEYINNELYENSDSLDDMKKYLIPLGFEFVEIINERNGAGNVVFKKSNI